MYIQPRPPVILPSEKYILGRADDMAGNRRRGHNEGSVWQTADGRWRAQISAGDGKRRSATFKTQREALDWKNRVLADLARGAPLPEGQQTVKAYLADWLESKRAQGLVPGTITIYERHIRLYIVPVIGRVRLDKLQPQHIQQVLSAARGKGLASSTIKSVYGILSAALKVAMRQGAVLRNVSELVDSPRRTRREMLAWTPEQARAVREAVRGERYEALYVLALATGMRQGELLGLEWRHLDLDCGQVRVASNLQREYREAPREDEPLTIMRARQTKTAAGNRLIDLDPQTVEALRAHRRRQLEERLAAGERWRDSDLVFCGPLGGPLESSALRRWHKRHLPAWRVPFIRFHDLRHTAATLMLLRGIQPHVVAKILGHASVAITLGLYGHVLRVQQQEAAAVMGAILHG